MSKSLKSLSRKPWLLHAERLEDRTLMAVVGTGAVQDDQGAVVGDFNRDGRDDVAIYDVVRGSWQVSVARRGFFDRSEWVTDTSPKSGWEWHVGDFSGDGRDDIAGYHESGGSWWMFESKGRGFSASPWTGGISSPSGWEWMVGDFDGNGRDDIAGYHSSDGRFVVNKSTGTSFVTSSWAQGLSPRTGWEWMVGDFDGNGRDDIAGYHSSNGSIWVHKPTGASFSTSSWVRGFLPRTGWKWAAADFSGDGRTDILGYQPGDHSWWVAKASTDRFDVSRWTTSSNVGATWGGTTGDINGDGRQDVVALDSQDGQIWAAISSGRHFRPGPMVTRAIDYVSAQIRGSTLYIRGDIGDNHITLHYMASNRSYQLRGAAVAGLATAFNGIVGSVFVGHFTAVDVRLGGGTDTFGIGNAGFGNFPTPLESLYIDMGTDRHPPVPQRRENVTFSQLTVTGDVTVRAEGALRTTMLHNRPTFNGTTRIVGGQFHDDISLEGQFSHVIIATGSGDDRVTLGNPVPRAYDWFVARSVTVDTGRDHDRLALFSGETLDKVMASLGDGNDDINLNYWRFGPRSILDGGNGRDFVRNRVAISGNPSFRQFET